MSLINAEVVVAISRSFNRLPLTSMHFPEVSHPWELGKYLILNSSFYDLPREMCLTKSMVQGLIPLEKSVTIMG